MEKPSSTGNFLRRIVHHVSEHNNECDNLQKIDHVPALEIAEAFLLDLEELNEEKSHLRHQANFENVLMDELVLDHQGHAEGDAEEDHVEPEKALHEDLSGLELAVDDLLGTLGLIELEVLGRL